MMQEHGPISPSVESLIADISFVNYCLQRDEADFSYWHRWLSRNPSMQSIAEEAKVLVLALQDRPSDQEVDVARQRLLHALGLEQPEQPKVRRFSFAAWSAAAVLLCCCGLGWVYFLPQRDTTDTTTNQPLYTTQTVPPGKIMHIRLADGTAVDLSSGSTLTYPTVFSDSIRTVTLDGDAKFIVAHQDNNPFVVRSNDFDVRVLGTTFHVQSFQSDRYGRVALFEGRVQLQHLNLRHDMVPGQTFVYDRQEGTAGIQPSDSEEEQQRANGLLIFDRASYEEVGQRLARKYGIRYTPNPEIDMAFSGRISNEPIAEVLRKLNFTSAYTFYLESNTLKVKHK